MNKIPYRYSKDGGYVVSSPRGLVSLEDVRSYFDNIADDQAIAAPFMEVVDLSLVEAFEFGYFEANELVTIVKSLQKSKGYSGACLVVTNNLTKSMSNILSEAGRDSGVTIKTFQKLEDACQYAEYHMKKS